MGALGLGLAAVVLLLDQISKAWVLNGLGLHEIGDQVKILPFFSFTLVHNIGISFGMLSSDGLGRWLLVLFQFIVALVLIDYVRKQTRPWLVVCLGLIIGGALGNGLDRLRFGFVVDFLDFSGTHVFPWVFNIADSGISIGVALLVWYFIRTDKPKASEQEAG
ncbi:signal peptidase II [Asticcacaulis sp. EMRT-3]|uniref:signal peptidase II n=1 Tax=Asticcacaulis sp. EMRT-3 TaxID=3040349 RepID=UPI0024AFE4C6|nr:signal peptidase II [Asticcacaulis sp. EMRT-3]MDI7774916.1 signal peptidase II [Asticcacaulis sp. EMRT-3]